MGTSGPDGRPRGRADAHVRERGDQAPAQVSLEVHKTHRPLGLRDERPESLPRFLAPAAASPHPSSEVCIREAYWLVASVLTPSTHIPPRAPASLPFQLALKVTCHTYADP